MSEIHHNHASLNTLYFCAFQPDGNVFLTGGASDEVWGTGGRDASDYAETMAEDGSGGHYIGTFTVAVAGTYNVTVFLQDGVSPVDADIPLAQGEIYWDGTNELSLFTIDASLIALSAEGSKVLNIYGEGE